MAEVLRILSVGVGTLLAIVLAAVFVFWFIEDVTQKKHAVLRNYPVIGRLRYFFEKQGEYFRQYFFAGDRDEMPFNRATRAWVYRVSKAEGGIIGFGSTYDIAKPGKGGVLPGGKVTPEIAAIRGIPAGQDSISPNRHRDAANIVELLDQVASIRSITGRPVGIKTAIGGFRFLNDMAENVHKRGFEYAPDFLVVDGGEGGSGAAPQALFDHMSLSIEEALPRAADVLFETGLKGRIRLVASGKLVTSARAAWALCVGADFINTARGFMFSLGCIQALRCHTNTCPTGITTHNPRLQRGLVVEEKWQRVANYAKGMNHDIEMIAHSCGVAHPRLLRHEHCPIVQANGATTALSMLYPYPTPNTKAERIAAGAPPPPRMPEVSPAKAEAQVASPAE